ncbi:sulfonate transport system ATP-binding protein [Streptomyces sp. Amel2xB2]|uniref:ABC transporter ATP-binding protein n=1 Tax=Streptomyces sp. Amel2xB2 TaxID=1305829 RepID=UPI000DB92158|nr:ABC transporter ATP-binding protein [Streptomyces sp. Amel2xB2]RAJ69653.1 sulfonate transport system ATP-binding protein [Streptomyces sp. Amel2xB2]
MAADTRELSRAEEERGRTAVHIEGLERSFGDRKVLDGLELDIRAGEFVALLGRSGSGKSTLLRALAGLDHTVRGTGVLNAPADVSVVFQDARLLPWKRVLDNVLLGLTGSHARERGRAALAEVGLADRESAWPVELSGGEQQRVSLARSLVREPELLLADEPFGALDALTRIRMHELLRKLCAAHRPAVLLVTHDVDEAIELADRVAVLEDGRITADVPVELDGPRGPGSPQYAALRASLLTRLGVTEAEREPERSPADAAEESREAEGAEGAKGAKEEVSV